MKRWLLPETGTFYKANLHCHTTLSDGHLTPEEIKEVYRAHGYSVVAYTDHDILIPHQDLADDRFLPLNGLEMEVHNPAGKGGWDHEQECHMCLIALDPDNLLQPCYHREKYLFGNAVHHRGEVRFDESLPDYERVYSHEGCSDMMRRGRESGFFVTYNHPTWSRETWPDYIGYRGMHAMEVYNHSCAVAGFLDFNLHVYEDFLRAGNRIFAIAADDNHDHSPEDSAYWDSCGGFTMIRAEKLEYRAVTDALVRGDFYASSGPEISALWFEDGKLHIRCSPAKRILCIVQPRRGKCVNTLENETVGSAEFGIERDDAWFYVIVEDARGRRAVTNAYFTDTLFED